MIKKLLVSIMLVGLTMGFVGMSNISAETCKGYEVTDWQYDPPSQGKEGFDTLTNNVIYDAIESVAIKKLKKDIN